MTTSLNSPEYSQIIVGTMNWGSWGASLSTKEVSTRIEAAFKLGLTTFDHADIYGDYTTETAFGTGFKASGLSRESVQFISKCGIALANKSRGTVTNHYNYTYQYILNSVQRSLEELQTDYLDLLLLHRPSPLMDPIEIQQAIQTLLDKGYIKSFGLSNFTPSQTTIIQQKLKVSANQMEISLKASDPFFNGALDHCLMHQITPMAWAPLGGILSNKSLPLALEKAFEEMEKKYALTRDAILLAWLLKHPAAIHPVIGTTKVERYKNAISAMNIDFDIEDWFYLLAAFRGHDIP
ncbi:MAG: aldo/keto reductase [Flavobacteriaceae bacterium]|jgi:predicted oxidoreductase|nr:aldo/keto reductase [Flavobacteriaceae bacterium]